MAHEHIYVRVTSFASSPPAARDAGQALAEAVGREEEEEGSGQRRAEEERHRVAARRLLAHPKPQPHGHVFAGLLFHMDVST